MGFIDVSTGANVVYLLLAVFGIVFFLVASFIIGKYATNIYARVRFARRRGKNVGVCKVFITRNKDIAPIKFKFNLNTPKIQYKYKDETKEYLVDLTCLTSEDGCPVLEFDLDNPIPIRPVVSVPLEMIDVQLSKEIQEKWTTLTKEEQEEILRTHTVKEIKYLPLKVIYFTSSELATAVERIVNWAKAKYKKDEANISGFLIANLILTVIGVIVIAWMIHGLSGDIATLSASLDKFAALIPKTVGGG